MIKNSKTDFLATINQGESEIFCPACGSPMTLKKRSTFNMILSMNSRKVLNDIIRIFRSFIETNENELMLKNLHGVRKNTPEGMYPFSKNKNVNEDGLITTQGADIIRNFLAAPDSLGVSKLHNQLLTIEDLVSLIKKGTSNPKDVTDNQIDKKIREKVEQLIKTLVFGFEPHGIIATVLDLVFDQKAIRDWIQATKIEIDSKENKKAREILKSVAPYYYEYLTKLLEIIDEKSEILKNTKIKSESIPEIKDRIARCMYAIIILLGHSNKEGTEKTLPFMEKGVSFDFSRFTMVSQNNLELLLTSIGIIEQEGFKISHAYKDLIDQNSDVDKQGEVTDESLEALLEGISSIIRKHKFLGTDLHNIVEFTCKGEPATVPFNTGVNVDKQLERRCGWYPKNEITHPIILIGSPGTGKSTVMMSGLTTLMEAAGSLGLSPRPTNSDDVDLINWYSKQFFDGELPKATNINSRFSVEIAFVATGDVKKRKNFIFTDIPGQMVSRSLELNGTDPVMVNLLKYTNTIIFFFDICTEPYFINVLDKGKSKDEWAELLNDVSELKKDNRGGTNQILLLNKLIEDIRQLRGDDEIKKDVTFICLIPKSDFFIGDSRDKTKFLNEFYQKLKENKIIDTSQLVENSDTGGYKYYRSVGGVAYKNGTDHSARKQKTIIELIDRKARDAMQKIADALNTDASNSDKGILRDTINEQLLKVIDTTFKKAYLIPVSAQGRPKDSNEGGEKKPPSQKLSEYVFITPIALALEPDEESENGNMGNSDSLDELPKNKNEKKQTDKVRKGKA